KFCGVRTIALGTIRRINTLTPFRNCSSKSTISGLICLFYHHFRRLMRLVKISVFILLLSSIIIGQTNRGGISGTVKDSNGAVVPNAKVTITNIGTGQSTTVMTSSDGNFVANSLEPVEYSVLVEATNFKKSIVQKVKVDTA